MEGLVQQPMAPSSESAILVADHDPLSREHVARILVRAGHRVVAVADAESAIAWARRGEAELVIVDAFLRGVSGFDACRILKALPSGDQLPVVLLTLRTDTASRIEALRVRADDYVCKPVEERDVQSRVAALLEAKRLRAEIARNRLRLDRISKYDPLTDLLNFRELEVRLAAEFDRSERDQDPLACLLVDVDRMRHWNAVYGDAFGDSLLREVARLVRGSLREIDVVARYGGDEILVLLPMTHFAGALVAADRLWRDVAGAAWPLADPSDALSGPARVSVSIGISLFPSRDVRSKGQLLRAADASLLRSKRDGGNRICVFQHQGYIYSPDAPTRAAAPGPALRARAATYIAEKGAEGGSGARRLAAGAEDMLPDHPHHPHHPHHPDHSVHEGESAPAEATAATGDTRRGFPKG